MIDKLWNVMNDLDATSSKICSAREILDCAIDRLQEHQYDKVEQLVYAVDEFLQYYLQEFDERFKLAWQETVVKEKQKKLDDCMFPWGHSDMEYLSRHYTYDEMVAKGYTMSAEGFWIPPEVDPKDNVVTNKKWIIPVEEDGEDCVITFPDELIKKTGWKEGDVLEWISNEDGSYTLKKVEQ